MQTASEIKLQTSVAYLTILAKKHTSRYYTAMHRRRDIYPHQCEEKPSPCHATSTVLVAGGIQASAARGEVQDLMLFMLSFLSFDSFNPLLSFLFLQISQSC